MTLRQSQLRVILIVFLFVSNFNVSFSQWSQKNQGLNGGNILSLMQYKNLVLAGTGKAGVFISANNGSSWASSNKGMPREPEVTSLAKLGDIVYAGLYFGGIYKSNDNGDSWVRLTNSPSQITSLYVSGSKLLAGTAANGLYISSDNGNNWIKNSSLAADLWINTITGTSSSLFIGSLYRGVYRSIDNGNTWQALTSIPSSADVRSIAIDNGNIFAGATNNGIYLSVDNGDSWTLLGGITREAITSLCYIGNALYGGTIFGGLYKSTNNGSSWSAVNLGRLNSVSCIIPLGTTILVGTSDGLYLNLDGSPGWKPANANLTAIPINSLKAFGSKVLAGAQFTNGLFFSNNQASTWSPVVLRQSSTNSVSSLATYVRNDTLIGCQDGLVKLSIDGGLNWSDFANSNTYSFALLAANNGDLLRATGSGLYVYKKNGSGWNLVTNGINSNQWVRSLVKVGTDIFAGTVIGQGVLRSKDNGLTWESANSGLGSTPPSIDGVYASSNKLFAVTNNSSFYASTDFGNSWRLYPQSFGFINDITFSNGIGFMATTNGVLLSLNNGETWVDSGNSFPSYLSSYAVSCNADKVFAGTSQGVWEIPLTSFFPTISSFSPTSGKAGTTVTIDGTNFTTPEFLTVKFNGVVAQVISSTSTKIIVNVPANAASGLITVTVNGQSATSLQDFCVTPDKPKITLDLSDASNPKLVSSSLNGNQWFFNETVLAGETSPTLLPKGPGSYTVQVTLVCAGPISDVYCFNIPKPIISADFADPSKPKLTSSSDNGNQWFLNGTKIDNAISKIYLPDQSGSISLTSTNFGCTSQLSDAIAVIITGDILSVEEPPILVVYPSPASNFITIRLNNYEKNQANLTIYDMLGRHVKTVNNISSDGHVEDVSDFPSGVYVIKVSLLNIVYQERFVKN